MNFKQNHLIFATIIMLILITIAFLAKNWRESSQKMPIVHPQVKMELETPIVHPQVKMRLDRLDSLMNMVQSRLAITSSILNNNTAVLRYDRPINEMVYINGDWTLEKAPTCLSDLDKLNEYVRFAQSH